MSTQDLFLKIPGIDGESKDPAHPNEMQLLNFSLMGSFHLSAGAVVGTSGGTGKVSMQDAIFGKTTDKANPNLFKAMWTRQLIPKATLVVRKAGKQQMEYLKYEFEDAYITQVGVGASGMEPMPLDSFNLSFSKLTIEYKEQKADGTLGGSVVAKFDLKAPK
jgi:type VI secretion system secreted protein Hcp